MQGKISKNSKSSKSPLSKCDKWVHGRCAKMKKVTSTLAKDFVCELCVDTTEGIWKPSEEISFFDQANFVKSFCYLGDKLITSGGSKAAVTARSRIGCIKFRECGSCFMEESVCQK